MRRLRLLALLLPCLLAFAPSLGAEEPKPAPPPAEPKPDTPPGQPEPGQPGPGDPAPAEPPSPAPAPGGAEPPAPPPAQPPVDEEEQARRDEEERKRLEEERQKAEADDGAVRPPLPQPTRPGPGGTRYIPGGEYSIGTGNAALAKLLEGLPADARKQFMYEAPQHKRTLPAFWIDAVEVTNAQYSRFLEDHRTAYTCTGQHATLKDVAGFLLGLPEKDLENDNVLWRQLAMSNKDALSAAMPNVAFPDGFRAAVLPRRDLTLVFVTKRPPDDWPSMFPDPERLAHPVRYVSCLDAYAFCEWAGKHLQSEFEYEVAACGPVPSADSANLLPWLFPWGNKWKSDLSRCNWGAKNVNKKTFEADTWNVGSAPGGRSQFDVYDLIGNVAEWTSSPFVLYDEARVPKDSPIRDNAYLGAPDIRIIRGGTAVDQALQVLRPTYRNYIGEGVKAPPYTMNRFRWVGFRPAWWPQPGANQAPFILDRIYGGGRLKPARKPLDEKDEGRPAQLDDARLAGSVAENYIPTDGDPENGVSVLGRCRAVVAIPRSYVLDTEESGKDLPNVGRSKSKAGLMSESETESPIVLLGAFHTDATLLKVWKRLVLPPPANEEERKEREKEAAKKRGRSEAPAVVEGTLPPGSYILGLWHKRLCLLDRSREFQCFLNAPDKQANLEIKKVKAEEAPPACKVEVDADLGTLTCAYAMPLMIGKGSDPTLWLTCSFSVEAQAKDLESANGWR